MSKKHTANHFNLLRLIAALLVVLSHSIGLLGGGKIPDWLSKHTATGMPFSAVGLTIFFTISGFLIQQSWERNPRLATFWRNRALRLVPAVAAMTIVLSLIVGPMLTSYPLTKYFTDSGFYKSFITCLVVVNYGHLPSVFLHNPLPRVVTGSLWTLPYEVILYVVTSLQFVLPKWSVSGLMLATTFTVFLFATPTFHIPIVGISSHNLAYFSLSYTIGVAFSYFHLWRLLPLLPAWGIMAGVLITLILCPIRWIVLSVAVPLAIFRLAFAKTSNSWLNVFKKVDYSYGVYIWSFPLQQAILHYYSPSLPAMIMLSFVGSLLLGAASWHLVEKRFLKMKTTR